MTHPYRYETAAQALYWPARGPLFFDGWNLPSDTNDADLLCAEMCRLAYADRQTLGSLLPRVKFSLRHWIGGKAGPQRTAAHGTDGFIATSDTGGRTVLVFRGTESNKPEDILADAFAALTPWHSDDPGRGKVHVGFADAYAAVRNEIHATLAT